MFIFSFLSKAFMLLLIIATIIFIIGFIVIVAKGSDKGSGDTNNNHTPWG